ncbi:hypothetical protein LCGC14_1628220 [marine sediment metagenome]|uniref:Uncharacterized protein n=1 Tax=marine sediment metagenome TaxID=412755 RepID=A0A0F9KJ31_9ZZZZ
MILEDPRYSKVKEAKQTFLDKVLGRTPLMAGVNCNIVTDEGDALIADLMCEAPAKQKFDNANAFIEVGTGFVSEVKTALSCTTPTGSPEEMDGTTYPIIKGAFGGANDNVTQYRATFEAGDLDATGIDESALLNNITVGSAECLAYAQITPTVDVSTVDTLQMNWELTYTGA